MKHKFSKALVLAGMIGWYASIVTVQAGGINANEEQIMEVVNGTFAYEGKTYKVYPEYIQKAKNYLSKDDVDLTAQESQEVITNINANVLTGIENQYIYEVSENAEPTVSATEQPSKETESPNKQTEQPSKETESPSKENNLPDTSEDSLSGEEILTETTTSSNEQQQEEVDIDHTDVKQESEETVIPEFFEQIIPEESSSSDEIIKNTGFSMRSFMWTAMALAIVYLLTIFASVAIRYEEKKKQKFE